jgi:hypothetical protein
MAQLMLKLLNLNLFKTLVLGSICLCKNNELELLLV